jgi:hypothetical protein
MWQLIAYTSSFFTNDILISNTRFTYSLKNLYTTLVLTEEFPHSIPVSSKAPKSCTVQESTLENGMKIISYDNESGVRTKTFTRNSSFVHKTEYSELMKRN